MERQGQEHVEVSRSISAPSEVDNHFDPGCTQRSPSHAALSAVLVKKQNLIESTDEIKEGSTNLYFRAERALDAVHDFVIHEVESAVEGKQDKIKSTDDVPEGLSQYFEPARALAAVEGWVEKKIAEAIATKQDTIAHSDAIPEGYQHLYYTNSRAKAACVTDSVETGNAKAPSAHAVAVALSKKQDVVKSTDDISEGIKNQYFKSEVVDHLIQKALKSCAEQIESISKKCSDLQAQIDALKPKWSDQFSGGSGSIRFCTSLSHQGARWAILHFNSGLLSSIEQINGQKQIGPNDP